MKNACGVNYAGAIAYIEKQEATEISYCKVGESSKKLMVSFASNGHSGFDRKTSLMKLRYERNDFDVLYLRNQFHWYLGDLTGIGKNINNTISFLKKKCAKYEKVIFMGVSAGGYAAILFGSLLNADAVISAEAQTDLDHLLQIKGSQHENLFKRKIDYPNTWKNYSNLKSVLSESVNYIVWWAGDDGRTDISDLIYHGDHHYNLIKNHPNLTCLKSKNETIPKIVEWLNTK